MKLSWKEAYWAAYGFLDTIWQTMPEEDRELLSELDDFLGSMIMPEDGISADPALTPLWHEAHAHVTRSSGWGDLTEAEAYQVMVRFLSLWAEEHSDGTLLGICADLSRTDSSRKGWSESVEQVLQGDFDPYFGLTGDVNNP